VFLLSAFIVYAILTVYSTVELNRIAKELNAGSLTDFKERLNKLPKNSPLLSKRKGVKRIRLIAVLLMSISVIIQFTILD